MRHRARIAATTVIVLVVVVARQVADEVDPAVGHEPVVSRGSVCRCCVGGDRRWVTADGLVENVRVAAAVVGVVDDLVGFGGEVKVAAGLLVLLQLVCGMGVVGRFVGRFGFLNRSQSRLPIRSRIADE